MKSILQTFFTGIISMGFLIYSCQPKTEIITKNNTDTLFVTINDTIILLDTVTVLDTIIQTLPDTATTFILLRHAETTGIGSDPNLSAEGLIRAGELQKILENVSLEAVFSTNFNRTMETAQPTATDKSLPITNYDPFGLNPFITTTLATYKQGIVLVVGHSNTTPDFLNKLIGANTYAIIPETEYDNIYLVTVFEKGRSKVIHMKYGN